MFGTDKTAAPPSASRNEGGQLCRAAHPPASPISLASFKRLHVRALLSVPQHSNQPTRLQHLWLRLQSQPVALERASRRRVGLDQNVDRKARVHLHKRAQLHLRSGG